MQFERNEAKRVKELEAAKTRFFSNISHEFKTPLTLLLGPINDLFKDSTDERERYLLNIAQRNGCDLLQLVSQLLDLNKIEEGMLQPEFMLGELSGFVNGVSERMETLAREKEITLSVEVPETRTVGYDGQKVERILVNLLSNAIKYAPEKGQVNVTLGYSENSFEIKVEDNGPGIDSEDHESVFKPFYQVGKRDSYRAGGTGSGLALSKEYADLMGGDLWIEHSSLGGASFVLTIPFHESSEREEEESHFEIEIPTIESWGKNGVEEHENEDQPLILIVEDNDDLRSYLKVSLMTEYRIAEAENGREGFAKALELIPDVVLTDIMMPEVDGIELCSMVKGTDETCHIPVILFSALSALETKLTGLRTGADDYVVKPFSKQELVLRIGNLLKPKETLRDSFRNEYLNQESDNTEVPTEDPFILKAQEVLSENFSREDFDVSMMFEVLGVSRSSLHRKLKAVSGLSATQFIRTYRMKKAMALLRIGSYSVKEVGYAVGFSSANYFTRCFTEHFGVPPSSVSA